MSPSSGDVAQAPDSKSTSGLASVIRGLTGKKSSNPPSPALASVPATNPSFVRQFNSTSTLRSAIYGGPSNHEQLYEQLRTEKPLPERLAAAETLRYAVADYPLSGVTIIWYAGKDLIGSTKPVEARIAGFELLTACVKHGSSTDLERKEYFDTLTAPANLEDFHLQLAALIELAKHGRDLSGFHYDTIPLLTKWLRQSFLEASSARKQAGRSQNRAYKSKALLGEETNLAQLFDFIVDVIKFSFNVSSERIASNLIDALLYICIHTPLSGDLKACINVIDAIVTYGAIPSPKLLECVKVLCSIHCLVNDVQAEAWRTISNLCKSHNGQTTVRILLDILREPPLDRAQEKQTIREIRGALSVLERLTAKDGEKGYPQVPFALLMDGLAMQTLSSMPKSRLTYCA
jgi:hypothetical protein